MFFGCDMAVSDTDAGMDVSDEACAEAEFDRPVPEASSVPGIEAVSACVDEIELGPCEVCGFDHKDSCSMISS